MVFRFFALASFLMLITNPIYTYSALIPVGGPFAGEGDGINTKWININYQQNTLVAAILALDLKPGNAGYIGESGFVANNIDFSDFPTIYPGGYLSDPPVTTEYTLAPYLDIAGLPQTWFSVQYSGYINIKSEGTYDFLAFHDDGFRLSIGGQIIMEYDSPTAPKKTTKSVLLAPGLYSFSMVSWDEGGSFINELAWKKSSQSVYSIVGKEVLFTSAPVPEPATMILFATGLAGLIAARRRKKKSSADS